MHNTYSQTLDNTSINKEYKIAKGWAIFIYVFAPLLIALFGSILIMPFIPSAAENEVPVEVYWIIIPISVTMIVLFIIGIIDTIKGKFVIGHDRIYLNTTLTKRTLLLDEIKGYRVTSKFIFIESSTKGKKQIKLSTYVGSKGEIIAWLASHYPDLDKLTAEMEEHEILENKDFGATVVEREQRLKKARTTTKIINWTAGLISAWTFFAPDPYEYLIVALMIIPIPAILILKFSKGIIRLEDKNDTAYPTIFAAVFFPAIVLAIRALLDYNIFNYENIWLPACSITAFIMTVVILGNNEFSFRKLKGYLLALFFSACFFAYTYGTIIGLNNILDQSIPQVYHAKILSKRISSGKTKSYYFKLTSWGPEKYSEEVSVSKELYNELGNNDIVTIYFSKGRFDIPWFVVGE
ncbi:MAG: hypothetical protein J7604_15125 [Sporocytophaga sp.]|uniref:hypothetical protein n=1 Tax=Sporocytophaga sp. TaxID=2231183 RepID=UPI001B04BEC0|nr:hypothetical protein [Sporocytophaga sp.]MBO9701539.1 hypothetical protein [Sporocytophaga sp.]